MSSWSAPARASPASRASASRPRHASIPVDFGLPPLFGDAIEIVVDAEFQRDAMNVVAGPVADELVMHARHRGAARARVRRLDRRPAGRPLVGAAATSRRCPARWTCGRAAPGAAACARPTARVDHQAWGVYREIVAPERLVFTYRPKVPGIIDPETLVTVTFADLGGRTRLTLRHSRASKARRRAIDHQGGWTQRPGALRDTFRSAEADGAALCPRRDLARLHDALAAHVSQRRHARPRGAGEPARRDPCRGDRPRSRSKATRRCGATRSSASPP